MRPAEGASLWKKCSNAHQDAKKIRCQKKTADFRKMSKMSVKGYVEKIGTEINFAKGDGGPNTDRFR